MNQESSFVKGYELRNHAKVVECAEGNISRGGHFAGVGYENENALLAEYDKRGGLIVKDGQRIATGSFYDFKKRAYRTEPLVQTEAPRKKLPAVTTEEVGNNSDDVQEGAKDEAGDKPAKLSKKKSKLDEE